MRWIGFVSFFLVACSPPKQVVRVGIAAQQSPSQMLTYLAKNLGYFGPDVQVEEFAGSSKAMEALLGGSLDVVSGYHEQIMALPPDSARLQSFVAMTNGHLVALVSTKGIKRVEDLRGKTVGVTTLGSATQLLLNFVLAQHGMTPQAVHPVAIGTAVRAVAAMKQGAVDAGVVSDYTVKMLGPVEILADGRTSSTAKVLYGVDQYPGTTLFAKKKWLEDHPAAARSLAHAIRESYRWAKSHTPAEVAAKIPGQDPAVIESTMAMLTPDGKITLEGAEAARRVAASKMEAKDSYTNEMVDAR